MTVDHSMQAAHLAFDCMASALISIGVYGVSAGTAPTLGLAEPT